MKYQLIYQFCLKNYENEFQMLDRIYNSTKDYHTDMMDLERYIYDLNFFTVQNPMVLVDIIPPFLTPVFFNFNFNDYNNSQDIISDVSNVISQYIKDHYDPENCMVIRLIHDIPIENSIN